MPDKANPTADRELKVTRRFDAPPELVFNAWKDPKGISNWWGPRGFTTTTHEMDFRPGGVWRFTMHGPDGTDYPNRITYETIDPPNLLTYSHRGENADDPVHFKVEVTFKPVSGKTEITFRMVFDTAEELARVKQFGAEAGLQHTVERLAEHLHCM